jgi:hypothetical protein
MRHPMPPEVEQYLRRLLEVFESQAGSNGTENLIRLRCAIQLHCSCNQLAARAPKWTVANPVLSEM